MNKFVLCFQSLGLGVMFFTKEDYVYWVAFFMFCIAFIFNLIGELE